MLKNPSPREFYLVWIILWILILDSFEERLKLSYQIIFTIAFSHNTLYLYSITYFYCEIVECLFPSLEHKFQEGKVLVILSLVSLLLIPFGKFMNGEKGLLKTN